ncbi:hypothetical protein [Actinoplanes sp. NPDC049118]|uniref:hypothetical protein n=1 Tax=Actinoplanes sp. NPDC049118 TaxID=3155769 RepID=UPI0033E741E6
MALDLGNVPDWIQAIGASGALIYLAVQHQFDRKKTREAREEAERARRDTEAAQARQVVVTYSWRYEETVGCFVTVNVLNDSDRLIRHVALTILDKETGADGVDLTRPVDDPEEWRYTVDQITAHSAAKMRAQSRRQPVNTLEQSQMHGYRHREEHAAIELEIRYEVSVVFTDASGLVWRQWLHGYPERLTTGTPPPSLLHQPVRSQDAKSVAK